MVEELAVAHVLLAAVALISCLSVTKKRTIRTMPRVLWVTVILLVPLGGSIGWFLAGRPHRIGRPPRPRWRDLLGPPEPPRPLAPEDDPDFLGAIERPTGDLEQTTEDDRRRRGGGDHGPEPGPDP